MAKPLREFSRFIWWMQTQRRGGRQRSDQANRLGLRVHQKEMAATVHIHHRHFIITQPESWYSFYRPTEGGRLSRPRHCSKGVQPVPKTVYRSGCCDKHNCPRWDLNLGPLTLQSGTIPLEHCNILIYYQSVAQCAQVYKNARLVQRLNHGSERQLLLLVSRKPLSTAQPVSTRRRFDALTASVLKPVNCVTSMQHARSVNTCNRKVDENWHRQQLEYNF